MKKTKRLRVGKSAQCLLENTHVNAQRKGLSVSIQLLTNNPFCVCTCRLLQSVAWGLQPNSVWRVVLFIGIKWRAKMTQLLTKSPLWEKPIELQTTGVPNVHLPVRNPVLQTHFSIIIVVSQYTGVFQQMTCILLWKLTHVNKEIELSSRSPRVRSLYHRIKSRST